MYKSVVPVDEDMYVQKSLASIPRVLMVNSTIG